MPVGVGSAPVPRSGSGLEPSPSARCSQTPTIIRITTRMVTPATTQPPQLTIHRRRIIHPHGAVGAPITITITLVEQNTRTSDGADPASPRQRFGDFGARDYPSPHPGLASLQTDSQRPRRLDPRPSR